ncbi:MAG: hypothetical protein NUV73_00940 [Candidatus Daviesbacteria bacterium]|nr:hypothetical protein [Candidatus Daviesbacteria bacterium]
MNFGKESLNVVRLPAKTKAIARQFVTHLASMEQPRALMHPFFKEDEVGYTGRRGHRNYRQERDDMLADSFRKGSVPLIFEEYINLPQLSQRLKRFGPGTVYAWMTPVEDPTPLNSDIARRLTRGGIFRQRSILSSLAQETEDSCWDDFTDLVMATAVNGMVIGGQLTMFLQERNLHDPRVEIGLAKIAMQLKQPTSGQLIIKGKAETGLVPGYCVGTLIGRLAARGISSNLSLPSWPNDLWENRYSYLHSNEVLGL